MKKITGLTKVNDDEWYTPLETARKVAGWLSEHLPLDTPILCPADILPDGSESTIPVALREVGFTNVRVTRDLPVDDIFADWRVGEMVVTNPPFSLLVLFREWARRNKVKFCVLSRPGAMRCCWPIRQLKDRFCSTDGRGVAAAWMQNLVDTSVDDDEGVALGNCKLCESKACPKNVMTGDFVPGEDRKLYGWGNAVKFGYSGFFCVHYTTNGNMSFSRFFRGEVNNV